MSLQFQLPDILSSWPWPRTVNPHTEECGKRLMLQQKSQQYKFFPSKVQAGLCQAAIQLASLAYPKFSKAQLQVAMDLMFVFAVFDDSSDHMNAESVQIWANAIMDTLRSPLAPRDSKNELQMLILSSFWLNATRNMSSSAQKQFVEEFESYTRSVTEQAKDRDGSVVRGVESYLELRRNDLGEKPAFSLILMDKDIPEELFESDLMLLMKSHAIDMLTLANDMFSYNIEQSRGDSHNIVSIIMAQEDLNIHQALDHVSKMHDDLATEFLQLYETIDRSANPSSEVMKQYADGLGNWIRANECWSFESRRYFDKDGLTIKQTRLVELLPKVGVKEDSSQTNDPPTFIKVTAV
ncbi:terpenoid synthase [Lentinula aff. detonsa]|nr:terpenoid synthase [Lentinula aff. detonsa]